MPSLEYYEGREMESNNLLHKKLVHIFELDSIQVDGSSGTKIDISSKKNFKKINFSVKNVSSKNTQIHLTTIKKFCNNFDATGEIREILNKWLGNEDVHIFRQWSKELKLSQYEVKHQRLKSCNIDNWAKVQDWFNILNNKKILPNLLIQGSDKINYLIWINKKQKTVKIVDVKKLIDFVSSKCKWLTMPSGTTLRCVTPENKPIMWLQMKGNKTSNGYNHSPQFHIVENWPKDIIKHEFSLE